MRKSKEPSKKVPRRKRRVGDDVSPMEELSDQYTIEAVDPLFRLAWDKDIDLDHKLRSLYAIHRNFQLVLQRLRCQHEEQARVKSNEWRHLADASEQLRADLEPATTGERRYPDWFLA